MNNKGVIMDGKLFKIVNQYMYWKNASSYGIVEVEDVESGKHYFARDFNLLRNKILW